MNETLFGFPAIVVLEVAVCRLIWWSNSTTLRNSTSSSGCYSTNPNYSSNPVQATLEMANDFTFPELTRFYYDHPERLELLVDAIGDILTLSKVPPTKNPHILMDRISTLRWKP